MSDLRAADLPQQTVETARRWAAAAAASPADRDAARLTAVVRDPDGLAFSLAVVDGVLGAADPAVAARTLDALSRSMPSTLPWHLRAAVSAAGGFGPLAPRSVIGVARKALRRTLQHLVVDAAPEKRGAALAALRAREGVRLDVSVLGPAVLGRAGADRRLAELTAVLGHDDVAGVRTTVDAVVGPSSPWAVDETSALAVERLTPLYERALAAEPARLVTLEVTSSADLDLTIDVFTRLLDQPHLRDLVAGVALPTGLPDSLPSLQLLTDWARGRVARGGAPIRVRLSAGGDPSSAVAEADRHGWAAATPPAPVEADAAHHRVLDWALRPAHAEVAHVAVAARGRLDLAHAWTLARAREVTHLLDLEAELGAAEADAVLAEAGGLVLHVPVAPHAEPDAAVPWLLHRLSESAEATADDLDAAVERWLAAAELAARGDDLVTRPAAPGHGGVGDTDPALERSRRAARRVLARAATSHAGVETVGRSRVLDRDALEEVVSRTAQAGVLWGRAEAATRAQLLDRAAAALAAARTTLVEVLVGETGTTVGEADHQVSEVVDAARRHAALARGLEGVTGARWAPPRLTVVVSDAAAALAAPAEGATAALAAGSGVVLKPDPRARRTSAVLCEVLWAAGVPPELLALAELDEDDLGRDLVVHPAVDRVVFSGSVETARLFRSWRPDLPLTARLDAPGVVVVTPSADVDLAVDAIVRGAVAGAGRSRVATSHVLLVGSAGDDSRLRRQLVDAVTSLEVGRADDLSTRLGPLVEPAGPALRAALTTLREGDRWLVEPRQLDDEGALWSLGVVEGVGEPGVVDEAVRGPLLRVVRVATLDEALAHQAALGGGHVAAVASRDVDEVARWVRRTDAGALVVNGSTADVAARRQPAAGWGRSSVGMVSPTGADAVVAQGRWWSVPREPQASLRLTGLSEAVVAVIEAARSGLSFEQFDRVRSGAVSDEQAWQAVFAPREAVGAGVERVLLRHRARPVVVRLSSDGDLADLVRLLVAAARAGAPVDVSSPVPLPAALVQLVRAPGAPLRVGEIVVEGDEAFRARAAAGLLQRGGGRPDPLDDLELLARAAEPDAAEGASDDEAAAGAAGAVARDARGDGHLPAADPEAVARYRDLVVRMVGGDPRALAVAVGGSLDVVVHAGDVTEEGRVELLPFVREQAVAVVTHRAGHVDPAFRDLRL
ncbi:proline dehydrogenase family protein [Frigoribacterium sp. CFBP 13707]|uniref:proline dehydrogenase family protein n=1 Tax=Frigoribacterium sp. CFBP 13707 TaxID=2775313 RepID=UPI001783E659|nr:proline dehydrogenase family protein [Frigoribacterium sp. CFBP 13707]MBD8728357.1 proline dehydrogenase family protein [Frigoribacterium sp. CFBP 13707]